MDLSNRRWSFSDLEAYERCPSQFYRHKVLKEKGEPNGYASCGNVAHQVLKELEIGAIDHTEARARFLSLWEEAGKPGKEKNVAACSAYFGNLTGWELDWYNVLMTEKYWWFNIGIFPFIGAPDLILEDKFGQLILVDHKSHKHLLKQDGTVLKGEEQTFLSYKRQAYIYSELIHQLYGRYPVKLVWNHFQDAGTRTVIPFSGFDFDRTIGWVNLTIGKILKDEEHLPKKSYFFCRNLCEYRNSCTEGRNKAS